MGPARSTLQGLRWLLHAAAEHSLQLPTACSPSPDPGPGAAHVRPHARRWVYSSMGAILLSAWGSSQPQLCSRPTRDPLAQREDESCSAEKIKELQPTHRLLPPSLQVRLPQPQQGAEDGGAPITSPLVPPVQKVSAKGPGKRKKKVKVRKKGTGQLSPAEEPEGGAAGGADGRGSTAGGLMANNRVGQEEPVPAGMAAPHSGERRLWELLAPPMQAPRDPQSHPKRGCGDPDM